MFLFLLKSLIIIIAITGIVFFYTRYIEFKSLYYPRALIEGTPEDIGLAYKDEYFKTPDGIMINAWIIKAKEPKAVVIFAHGNGGNISHRLEKIEFFNKLDVDLCIFDYRGYGRSQGMPSEGGLYADIQTVYKAVKKMYPELPIILYGESLGGAIVIDLASRIDDFPVSGVIVEGTFTNVGDMAKVFYPGLPCGFLKTRFDSLEKVSKIQIPKLHLHSEYDDIVPYELGMRLYTAAEQPKTLVTLDGLHNEAFFVSLEKVKKSIREFIDSVVRS